MLQIRKKKPRKRNFGANHEGCQLVDSPIILEALIEGFLVRRIYVDRGSSSEVMYEHCFRNLRTETRAKLKESRTPLVGFSGEKLRSCSLHYPLNDKISNRRRDRDSDNQERNHPRVSEDGRSTRTNPVRGAIFQTPDSEGTISRGREESQGQTNKEGDPKGTTQPPPSPPRKDAQTDENIKGKDEHPEGPLESKPLEKVVIHDDYPDQTITIRGNLSAEYISGLIKILRKHADAFAWTPADMTGIPRFIAEHELKTYPHIELRVQQKRSIAPDRRKVVKEEVAEWLKAGIVRRVRYPTWVANPVLVKKPDGSWRMCIDFKDLNKACPKRPIPYTRDRLEDRIPNGVQVQVLPRRLQGIPPYSNDQKG
ncbi:hypothetical protein Tco_0295396 [Tanacetum coccineum]